jgi:hypothetical protein
MPGRALRFIRPLSEPSGHPPDVAAQAVASQPAGQCSANRGPDPLRLRNLADRVFGVLPRNTGRLVLRRCSSYHLLLLSLP